MTIINTSHYHSKILYHKVGCQEHACSLLAKQTKVPMKEVQFEFPTNYADTGKLGDRLWDELMPRRFKVFGLCNFC